MIDFGYSKYQNFQTGTALIHYGLGGFMNWSYADSSTPVGVVGKYRTLMGVGV